MGLTCPRRLVSLRRALPFVSRNSSLASTWCFIAKALASRSDLTAQFGCPLASAQPRISNKGDRKSENGHGDGKLGKVRR